MTRHTKHVDHARKPDGSSDQSQVIAATEEALAAMKRGDLVVNPLSEFKVPGVLGTFKVLHTNEE